MHIVFDWDNTLADLRPSLARAISKELGYTVAPSMVAAAMWDVHFGVDAEKILAIIDSFNEPSVMTHEMAALVRELWFCGCEVSIVTARGTDYRMKQVEAALAANNIQGVRLYRSQPAGRTNMVRTLGGDIFIDDLYLSCADVAKEGIQAVWFGGADVYGAEVVKAAQLVAVPAHLFHARTVAALRNILANTGVPMLPARIGLAGVARAGKDTVGRVICRAGFGYQQMSFAAALKYLAMLLLDPRYRARFIACNGGSKPEPFVTLAQLYQQAKREDISQKTTLGRTILQFLGHEVVRECISDNLWIDLVNARERLVYGDLLPAGPRYILTDVRYENEIKFCQNGGVVLNVKRDSAGLEGDANNHASEQLARSEFLATSPSVIQVENNGTVEQLEARVLEILKDCAKNSAERL